MPCRQSVFEALDYCDLKFGVTSSLCGRRYQKIVGVRPGGGSPFDFVSNLNKFRTAEWGRVLAELRLSILRYFNIQP